MFNIHSDSTHTKYQYIVDNVSFFLYGDLYEFELVSSELFAHLCEKYIPDNLFAQPQVMVYIEFESDLFYVNEIVVVDNMIDIFLDAVAVDAANVE